MVCDHQDEADGEAASQYRDLELFVHQILWKNSGDALSGPLIADVPNQSQRILCPDTI